MGQVLSMAYGLHEPDKYNPITVTAYAKLQVNFHKIHQLHYFLKT